MSDKPMRFPRLGLRSNDVRDVSILAEYQRTDAIDEALKAHSQLVSDPEISLTTSLHAFAFWRYTERGQASPNLVSGLVLNRSEMEPSVAVIIEYKILNTAESTPPPSKPQEQNAFFSLVSKLGEPTEVLATVDFRVPNPRADALWFPLPTELSGWSPDDAYVIRGVRGRKVAASESDAAFDFTLERIENGDVVLSISDRLQGVVSPELIKRVLEGARRKRQQFVSS
jgi:hypothetical protein